MRPLAACTIISRNYLPHARILAESFHAHEANGRFYLLVVDRLPSGTAVPDGVEVVDPDELKLPYFYDMTFRYDVTELSTAVKPTLLSLLLHKYRQSSVIYFDPDILIMRRLSELRGSLSSNPIVLIPHLLRPIPIDGRRPSERDILIAGAYNLGFIAVRRSPTTDSFLQWWEERLREGCRVAPAEGLMTDQRWIDLVPSLFAEMGVLRDETYDVAYWNLHEREITRAKGGGFLVNGKPLAFFHFSGFDPAKPQHLSKHQDRIALESSSPLGQLVELYVELQKKHGSTECSQWKYGYEKFSSGIQVHRVLREMYLKLDDNRRNGFGNPFEAGDGSFLEWATAPRGPTVSRFLERVHQLRYDVAAAFPDVNRRDRDAFLEWARTQGAREMGYHPALVRDGRTVAEGTGAGGVGASAMEATEAGSGREAREVGTRGAPRRREYERRADRARPGVNVCGYLKSESGLGSAVRGYVRALTSMNVPVALTDVSHLGTNRCEDQTFASFDQKASHDINLVCVNADEHFRIKGALPDFFRDRYNIGVWAWELPRFPHAWQDRLAEYDEIWAGSSFVANAIGEIAPIPVVRVPPVLRPPGRGSRVAGRRRLGVKANEFVFLFVFDFHSFFERKNPLAIMKAFKRAFGDTPHVRLVIKCVNEGFDPSSFARLRRAARHERIDILAGYVSSPQMRDLMAGCDAYVSLHRSEGTGLTISDAMALGKPTIATAWSGNMDFMTIGNSFPVPFQLVTLKRDVGPYETGQVWAEPSIGEAAEIMKQVVEDPREARKRARAGRETIRREFSEAAVSRLIGERLRVITRAGRHRPRPLVQRRAMEMVSPALDYPTVVESMRLMVEVLTPPGATIAVVSKGDEAVMEFADRSGWHFPRASDGRWAGFYPKDSEGAIAHLEELRRHGADYFVLPAPAAWWLDYYGAFRRHLEIEYRDITPPDAAARIFSLRAAPVGSGTDPVRARRAG